MWAKTAHGSLYSCERISKETSTEFNSKYVCNLNKNGILWKRKPEIDRLNWSVFSHFQEIALKFKDNFDHKMPKIQPMPCFTIPNT